MHSVGIIANIQRDTALSCAEELFQHLDELNIRVKFPADLAAALNRPELGADEEKLAQSDLLIALGGDGTLLATNRIAAPQGVPVLGIHAGGTASFGFLTETTPSNAREAISGVLSGNFRVEERLMVAARLMREGDNCATYHGLNEIVIRGQTRMLKMRITVADTYIATYAADGIIVASPTGSTAYNLAAGGPLVHPALQTILLTPICPHTLNVRSLLVRGTDTIQVALEPFERDTTLLTADGQIAYPLEAGDRIEFQQSELRARFVTFGDGASFYDKVQKRLRLGERFGN